ncbi:MAG: hypothetical protein KF901_23095 [Myxococcales bacterium]|nr:hypothetical protein [Myxococcales bacterium]
MWRPSGTPRAIVVFLHGWRGCVAVLAGAGDVSCGPGFAAEPGWGLVDLHARAAPSALFVLPQLAFRGRSGSAGRFREPGYASRFLADIGAPAEAPIVLVAHSAGFESALAWLRSGAGSRVTEVVLLDALYAGTHAFFEWVSADPTRRRLSSFVVGRGGTRRENERLARLARRHGLALGDALDSAAPIRVIEGRASHGALPTRHLGEVLEALVPR